MSDSEKGATAPTRVLSFYIDWPRRRAGRRPALPRRPFEMSSAGQGRCLPGAMKASEQTREAFAEPGHPSRLSDAIRGRPASAKLPERPEPRPPEPMDPATARFFGRPHEG